MVSRFSAPVSRSARPSGWRRGARGWLCLDCQREEVRAAVPSARDTDGRAARRRALVEYELRRDPEAPDGLIAKRSQISPHIVGPIRVELCQIGVLPS
jgi:hypothetical protein